MDPKLILTFCMIAKLSLSSSAGADKQNDTAVKFEACNESLFTETECQKWVKEMSGSFPMATRAKCPFGLSQNPGVRDVIAAPKRSVAFEEAIGKIDIVGISPSRGTFLVGANEFTKGNIIPITYGKEVFNAQVVSVRSKGILFRNVKTGEQINKNLVKDKGVSPFKPIKNLPGVKPNRTNNTPQIVIDSN